jgi:hypothetical protein
MTELTVIAFVTWGLIPAGIFVCCIINAIRG